ncbi:hypothetical protein [Fictibacillus sp. 18YEL24]|uniref:hypothetical protein n=1 Tax=Fictibacillus sp. 18YEL24 TaxID=2745875 RepID=UPI0018CC91D0|nr:hypothetical protein [Fictibacillus sp. 18YEL24]MBH0169277.1 hypothetical protein [Fictibacillus sp. 18YEL24]
MVTFLQIIAQVIICLMILGLLLFINFRQLQRLKREIHLLPAPLTINATNEVFTNKNIFDSLPHLHLSGNEEHYLVAINSCTCPFCYSGMEELIVANDNKLQIINLVECDIESKVQNYLFDEEIVHTLSINKEVAKKLEVNQFPTYMLINKKGDVLKEDTWSKSVLHTFNN